MLRKTRIAAAGLLLGAALVLGSAAPAGALVCHEGQSCDCSVRVLKKVIIPCNQ
jgi:hypothetical protein